MRGQRHADKDPAQPAPAVPSDYSIHPSYTRVQQPYSVICRERSKQARRRYDRQFLRELEGIEATQASAYDAMRFHRHFAITTLWPPLHTRKEIDYVLGTMFRLTDRQQRRLNELLSAPQI